ncbi:hypothetical protein ACP70R_033571 [Stipagrostis hirtigluma subsp. patula]
MHDEGLQKRGRKKKGENGAIEDARKKLNRGVEHI